MTAPKDTHNVVDLSQRQGAGGGGDRLGDLLKLVRGIAQKRINGLVSTLFENVDDALFDLAERAGSNALQTEYFDGMREVRKKRQLVERLFQDQATKAFTDFADGKLKAARTEVSPQPASGGLSLVDDTELEESLAVIRAGSALTHSPGEFTVTVGFEWTVSVPTPSPEAQLGVLLSVTVTLYVPATVAPKLATSPGSVAPPGTDHW